MIQGSAVNLNLVIDLVIGTPFCKISDINRKINESIYFKGFHLISKRFSQPHKL